MGAKGGEGALMLQKRKLSHGGSMCPWGKMCDMQSQMGEGTLQRQEATASARGTKRCSSLTAVVQTREELEGLSEAVAEATRV